DYNSKKDRSNGIYVKAQQVVKKLKNGYDGNFATYDQNGHLVEIPLRTLSRVFFYRIGLKDYAMVLRQQPDTFTGIFTQTYLESNNINK
ncbi:MAG: hypothetical protein N3D84_02745, partial [Candidatus Woesearchaeota archaeon]|nr:hypothetical protein [Candidatus Woesearchaeota archaeon]